MSGTLYHKLLDACRERGCPLCTIERQTVRRYLDNLFYENVNSPALRRRLRESRGFCREHAWLVVNERLGDALGIAIVYRDILESLLQDMTARPRRAKTSWLLAKPSPAEGGESEAEAATTSGLCPACAQRDEIGRSMLAILVKFLTDKDMQAALRQSDGLCLRHFSLAFDQTEGREEARAILLGIQREKVTSLCAELSEFIRKNDYRYFGEGFGAEGDSWKRALAFVVGNNPWRADE